MEEIARLQQRLERERIARFEAERIAEDTIRNLYDRQQEIQLLRSVAFAANQARSVHDALTAVLALVCEHTGWSVGHAFLVAPSGGLVSAGIWHDENMRFGELRRRTDAVAFTAGVGLPGQVLIQASPVWVEDVTQESNFPRVRAAGDIGVRAALGVPVLVGAQVRAVLEFFHDVPVPTDTAVLDLMAQVGATLGRVIEREHAKRELHDSNNRLTLALFELQEAQESIVQQERLRALGQMASGIAHDFNNALHPIVGYGELLLDMPPVKADPGAVRFLKNILTSATDAAAVVSRLRDFYRPRDTEETSVPVDLARVAAQVVELTRPRWYNESLARGVRIVVETALDPAPPVMGREQELREAITNLVFNAVDAMPDGGTIVLRTRSVDGRVALDVGDSGHGMSEDVRRRCLEPFFTTKGDQGSGLGLGMVYGIVQRHDATLDIQSAPGKGTTITLSFPAGTCGAVPTAAEAQPVASSHLRVLVVDDKPAARSLVKDLLEADGHRATVATDGVDALSRLGQTPFDVVITDRSMPKMSGDELATHIKKSARPLPVIMLTGFGVLMDAAGEKPADVDTVLSKPVTRAALREALAAMAGRPAAIADKK